MVVKKVQGGVAFLKDDSWIYVVWCSRRFMSRRPGPSIAAAGDKGPVAV
jgi:hypothetical protein